MMETDDVLTFCQNELPYNSFIAFEDMRKNGQFCDLTIKVENHSFTAHRMILAAGIPYFKSVFANNTVDTGVKELTVAELDPRALESLIHFAYNSKVIITMENANSLLLASQFLQLNQVKDACVEFISKRLAVDSVLKVRNFATSINNMNLIKNCDLYIRMNFEEFSKCEDFLSLPHSCFKEIIADDDLSVSSEEAVFDAIMKWIKASPSERHVVLLELLSEVRLIFFPVHYLIDRIIDEELILSSKACRNLVNEAKNYHFLPERTSTLSKLKMRPRNHFRQELFALSNCGTCGKSVHCLVNETWRPWSYNSQNGTYDSVTFVAGVNDKIYIFFDQKIETFCITTREWEKLTTTHTAIYGAACVLYEDKIYCFGSSNHAFKTKLRCFDTKLNQWLEEVEMKTQWSFSAVASCKESIYVTGGSCNAWGDRINAVEKYSPSTGQWSDAVSMLTKRSEHGCTALSGKIYVCGGYTTGGKELNTAEVYDPNTNQWNYISSMVKERSSFTMISYHNRIYALSASDVEVYDSKDNEWKCCLYVPGGFQGAVLVRSSYIKSNSA